MFLRTIITKYIKNKELLEQVIIPFMYKCIDKTRDLEVNKNGHILFQYLFLEKNLMKQENTSQNILPAKIKRSASKTLNNKPVMSKSIIQLIPYYLKLSLDSPGPFSPLFQQWLDSKATGKPNGTGTTIPTSSMNNSSSNNSSSNTKAWIQKQVTFEDNMKVTFYRGDYETEEGTKTVKYEIETISNYLLRYLERDQLRFPIPNTRSKFYYSYASYARYKDQENNNNNKNKKKDNNDNDGDDQNNFINRDEQVENTKESISQIEWMTMWRILITGMTYIEVRVLQELLDNIAKLIKKAKDRDEETGIEMVLHVYRVITNHYDDTRKAILLTWYLSLIKHLNLASDEVFFVAKL